MPKKINVKNVLAALDNVDPNRRNPSKNGLCVYTSTRDPEKHCIAGQVLVDLGWGHKLPPVDDADNTAGITDFLRRKFTASQYQQIDDETLRLLSHAQIEADHGSKWGTVARRVRKEHEA